MDFLKQGLMGGLDFVTGGASRLLGEDTVSKIPVFGGIMGARSDAQKRLMETQARLAEETRKQGERNAQMRMNALGQQVMAFNPQNQAVAQMFGPEAAFNPQQFAQMANDPGARSREEYSAAHKQAMAKPWQTRGMEGWTADDIKRMEENERRKKMVAQNMQPLGPGPAPMQMPTPQAGRRF